MRNKLGFLIFLVIMVPTHMLAGNVYYVDAFNGNDLNDGYSLVTAWKTIGKANSELQPGDIVYIRGGTYQETISPINSGTPGEYITYAGYENEKVIITNVTYGVDLRNKHYIVIDSLEITNTKYWVYMRYEPSTHNVIKNCLLDECTDGWAGIYMGGGSSEEGHSHYNEIIDNTLIGNCNPDNLIQCSYGATYNLIQGNTFVNGPHNSIQLQSRGWKTSYNIIRNNIFKNYYHTAINVYDNADHNLVEENIILDSGENHSDNTCGSDDDRTLERGLHPGIQLGASENIIRNNTLINNGNIAMNSNSSSIIANNNRIYHNTLNQNYFGLYSNCKGSVNGNIIKNNIFYNNKDNEIYREVTGSPRNDYFINNNISGAPIEIYPDGNTDLFYLETNYPDLWHDNIATDPQFIDETNRDVRLDPYSPMIDAGAFLTKTTGSGSGTKISVEDARFFMDGWGIIQGDSIQLEGHIQAVEVIDVDYANNIITIDRSLSWYSGQGVSLPYSGYAPDIGADEPSFAFADTASYFKVTGTASMTAGSTNELTITAYDQYGNVATGYTGSKSLTFSGPSNAPSGTVPTVEGIDIGSTTSVNFTNGVSDSGAATLSAYKAETTTVDASDGSIHSFANASSDLDLSVNTATASIMSQVSGNNQSETVGFTLSNFFVVKVTDDYGNEVNGKSVNWSITQAPALAMGQSLSSETTTSNSAGKAKTKLTLGDKAGLYKVEASCEGLSGSQVAFASTAVAATTGTSFFVNGGKYLFFSIPYQFSSGNAETVLNSLGPYDPFKWRLFRYVNGGYLEYPDTPDFSPGLGYWLISADDKEIEISGSAVSSDVTVTLQPGWNQVGCPFTYSVTWDDIKSRNSALLNTNTVADILWGFDSEKWEYTLSTTMDPWKSYLVYNGSDSAVSLIIPYQ